MKGRVTESRITREGKKRKGGKKSETEREGGRERGKSHMHWFTPQMLFRLRNFIKVSDTVKRHSSMWTSI